MEDLHVVHVVQVLDAHQLLDLLDALLGEGHGLRLLVDQEVAALVLVAATGYGFYRWLGSGPVTLSSTAFEKPPSSRLTINLRIAANAA